MACFSDENFVKDKSKLDVLLSKIEEMKSQRAQLLKQLRQQMTDDEIIKKLLKSHLQDSKVILTICLNKLKLMNKLNF